MFVTYFLSISQKIPLAPTTKKDAAEFFRAAVTLQLVRWKKILHQPKGYILPRAISHSILYFRNP